MCSIFYFFYDEVLIIVEMFHFHVCVSEDLIEYELKCFPSVVTNIK